MKTKQLIAAMVEKAMRSRYAGKTVAERVSLIVGEQKKAVRLLLLRSFKKGEDMDVIVSKVKRYYDGVAGNGGPGAMARRLVQSEMTRFNARVAVKMGEAIQEETGRIPVYTYQTQQDEAVRPDHAAAQDVEYVDDEQAGALEMPPVSDAEALLEEPGCRCWLDVSYMEETPDGKKGSSLSRSSALAPAPVDAPGEREELRQTIEDAIRSGDYSSLVSDIKESYGLS